MRENREGAGKAGSPVRPQDKSDPDGGERKASQSAGQDHMGILQPKSAFPERQVSRERELSSLSQAPLLCSAPEQQQLLEGAASAPP